jgi:cellulose synthase/poly-beta-1,6-N-acetylglucosamine synthase-like glycosyltransferase
MGLTLGDVLVYIICYFGLFTSFYFLITLFENKGSLKDGKLKRYPFVTIVVPAYNEERTLAKTVNSLKALNYPKEQYEIIIVDDGSTDKTLEIARSLEGKYPYVKAYHRKNSGKGAAMNFAIKKARGEFVGALDADSFVDKDALKNILSRFDDENTMAVSPAMKIYDPKTFLEIIQEMEYVFGIFLRKIFSFVGSIHVTPGPFSIFRKCFFDKHGGFDEHNITEDVEIALRVQSKGYHIDCSTNAYVYTVAPTTFLSLLKQRVRWYYGFITNVEKYKHLFHPDYGNLGIIIMPSAFISIFLVIISLFYTLYRIFISFYDMLINILALGWDYFRLFDINTDLFFFNMDAVTVLSFTTLIVSILIIILANKMAKRDKGLAIRFILYTSFYWFFFAFWWIAALIVRISGRRVKWGHRAL